MKIIMLNGPPGSGKSTHVHYNRGIDDRQVDIDLIPSHLPQQERLAIRKTLLLSAANLDSPGICWFSTAAPTRRQREYWRSLVPIHKTIIFVPPFHVARKRQMERDGEPMPGISRWYALYQPPSLQEPNTVVYGAEYGAEDTR